MDGGDGRRVVLVHGFTQTAASWDPLVAALRRREPARQVVRMDLPGHGGSADVRLPIADAACAVGEAGGGGDYVGYSMGGRLVLRLAVEQPALVRSLVLIGVSPGIEDPAERVARRRADGVRARQIEEEGVDAFLDGWLRQPLFGKLRPTPADLAARRRNRPEALAAALRLLGTGAQEPLWDRLSELAMPVLAVAGADDRRFSGIARRLAAAVGANARAVLVPRTAHAVHLEAPDRVATVLCAFWNGADQVT